MVKKKHVQQPEPRAVEKVLDEYRPHLHRFLRSKLSNEADVEDIAQESYLRLLRVEAPELIRRPKDYLFRIASNAVHDFYLRQSRKPVMVDYDEAAQSDASAAGTNADDALTQRANIRRLEALIMELRPRQRAAFVLKKRDGLSHDEIAARLGISVHTARTYVSQALAHCRARWEE